MLFCGFLTKGFTALYPWSLPLWIWLISRVQTKNSLDSIVEFQDYSCSRKVLPNTITLIFATLLPLLFIYLFTPEGISSIGQYLDIQVIQSLKNTQTVGSRFFIVQRLFWELLPPFLLLLVIIGLAYKKKIVLQLNKAAIIFILLGLSGVLPIMVSLKQRGFYMLTTFPFFCLGFALIIAPFINEILSKISVKVINRLYYFSYFLLITSLSLSLLQFNKIGREKALIQDVYLISNQLPFGETIQIPQHLWTDWNLKGYFARIKNIGLDANITSKSTFYLCPKSEAYAFLDGYKKQFLDTKLYDLYIKKPKE